jgi:hypothetical protein
MISHPAGDLGYLERYAVLFADGPASALRVEKTSYYPVHALHGAMTKIGHEQKIIRRAQLVAAPRNESVRKAICVNV